MGDASRFDLILLSERTAESPRSNGKSEEDRPDSDNGAQLG
jgi:hypothetical protein